MNQISDESLGIEVRAALAEVLGLDEKQIPLGARLADDLGMGAFELESVLDKLSRRLEVSVPLWDVFAHSNLHGEPVDLSDRPWLEGDDLWMLLAEGTCSFCTVALLADAVRDAMRGAAAQPTA